MAGRSLDDPGEGLFRELVIALEVFVLAGATDAFGEGLFWYLLADSFGGAGLGAGLEPLPFRGAIVMLSLVKPDVTRGCWRGDV